uniref:Uncharacterized protein n=1 Tax=Angiostrongylus cantonensis TaxID=6313 RepID=C7TNY7_ANGCA|nr:hypothetical protein [Angiostrongylus cantonensis]
MVCHATIQLSSGVLLKKIRLGKMMKTPHREEQLWTIGSRIIDYDEDDDVETLDE